MLLLILVQVIIKFICKEEKQDKLRDVCKEINTLKTELREIKNLILKGKQ